MRTSLAHKSKGNDKSLTEDNCIFCVESMRIKCEEQDGVSHSVLHDLGYTGIIQEGSKAL